MKRVPADAPGCHAPGSGVITAKVELERVLEARLTQLTPEEQRAVLTEALDLLTAEEKWALLAHVAEALTLAGLADDAALLVPAQRTHDSGPTHLRS